MAPFELGRSSSKLEGRYKTTWKSGIEIPVAQGRSTTIISMIQWTRTSRLSIKISLSGAQVAHSGDAEVEGFTNGSASRTSASNRGNFVFVASLNTLEDQVHAPRKALRGGMSKSFFKRCCQLLAINAHKMAPRTSQGLQERAWDAPTKGLEWM